MKETPDNGQVNKALREKLQQEVEAIDQEMERVRQIQETSAPSERFFDQLSDLQRRKEKIEKDIERYSGKGE